MFKIQVFVFQRITEHIVVLVLYCKALFILLPPPSLSLSFSHLVLPSPTNSHKNTHNRTRTIPVSQEREQILIHLFIQTPKNKTVLVV